jgi:hypothetical protein
VTWNLNRLVGREWSRDLRAGHGGKVTRLRSDAGVETSGSHVTNWLDQSGNTSNAVGPAGDQPRLVPNQILGRPAIQFVGASNDYLVIAAAGPAGLNIANTNYEIFVVARSSSSAIQFLTAGGSAYELHLNSGGGLRYTPRRWADHADIGVIGHYTDGRAHIFSTRVDATRTNASVSRVDGVDGTDWTATNAVSSSTAAVRIGYRSNNTLPLTGDMFEVLIYNRTLATNERAAVEAYLWERWTPPPPTLDAVFSQSPVDMQLYPRDLVSGTATVRVEGVVTNAGYQQIAVEVLRSGAPFTNLSQALNYAGGTASFSFAVTIAANWPATIARSCWSRTAQTSSPPAPPTWWRETCW